MIKPQAMTNEYVIETCKPGSSDCCRYLTMGADGWHCERHSRLKGIIDARVESGQFKAMGINCPGVDYSSLFTCATCGGTFEKARSDQEAHAEREQLFPGFTEAQCTLVCDECFHEHMARLRAAPVAGNA